MTPDSTYEKIKNEADEFAIVRTLPTKWQDHFQPPVSTQDPNSTQPGYMKHIVIETKEEILKLSGPERGWADMDQRFCDECWTTEECADLALVRLGA